MRDSRITCSGCGGSGESNAVHTIQTMHITAICEGGSRETAAVVDGQRVGKSPFDEECCLVCTVSGRHLVAMPRWECNIFIRQEEQSQMEKMQKRAGLQLPPGVALG